MAKIPTRIAFGNVGQTSSSNRKSASAMIGVEWATDAFAVGLWMVVDFRWKD